MTTKEKARKLAEENGYGLGCTVPQIECYVDGYIARVKEENSDPFGNVYVTDLQCENKELRKQLEQAKEIIKEYMRFETMIGTCAFYSEEYEKTKKKAEQFIKE